MGYYKAIVIAKQEAKNYDEFDAFMAHIADLRARLSICFNTTSSEFEEIYNELKSLTDQQGEGLLSNK